MSQQVEMPDSREQSGRRPYGPPKLVRVDLKADEVLGFGCKTADGGPSAVYPGCTLAGCGAEAGS